MLISAECTQASVGDGVWKALAICTIAYVAGWLPKERRKGSRVEVASSLQVVEAEAEINKVGCQMDPGSLEL